MRTQKLVVGLAAGVTGLFLLSVGLVLAWPLFSSSAPRPGPLALNLNNNQPFFAPAPAVENWGDMPGMPDVQMARGNPIANDELPKVRGAAVPAKDYVLSGPHTHGNLSIFLVHGPDKVKDA